MEQLSSCKLLTSAEAKSTTIRTSRGINQSSNEIDDYWLVFTVSISLLRKILNASPN